MTVDQSARVRKRQRSAAVVGAAAVCGYAIVATTTRPNTTPAMLALLIPIAVVTAAAMRRARQPTAGAASPQQRRTTALWLGVTALGLLWEAAAYVGEHTVGAHDHPTISALLEPAMQQPPVRFAAWALWLLAGWRLVRR